MKVKGSMILDYVKVIRANKEKNWEPYLEPQDWDIIEGKILPSSWYPYETFQRIGLAIFREIAKSDLDTVRQFGRHSIKNFLNIYKTIIVPGDPGASLEKLASNQRLYMEGDFGIEVAAKGGDWLKYRIKAPPGEKDSEQLEAYAHQLAGSAEEIVLQAGGRDVAVSVERKKGGFELSVRWTK